MSDDRKLAATPIPPAAGRTRSEREIFEEALELALNRATTGEFVQLHVNPDGTGMEVCDEPPFDPATDGIAILEAFGLE